MRTTLRLTAAITIVLTVAAAGAVAAAGPSTAAGCAPQGEAFAGANDFDGDGNADAAYGEPSRRVAAQRGAGAIRVVQSCAADILITTNSLGLAPTAGARLGATVNSARLDSDAYTDLVVSAPGRSRVWIVFGSANGLNKGKPAQRIVVPGLHTGDRFGESLALITNYIDAQGHEDIRWNLVIGAPGTDVSNTMDAGAVYRLVLAHGSAAVESSVRWVQGSHGFPGAPEQGDQFGESLADASAEYPGSPIFGVRVIAVGVPHEDVGKAKDAGAVYVVAGLGLNKVKAISRATAHVPGTASAGDRFGHAVAGLAGWLYVGAPGDDISKAKNAGSVQRVTLAKEAKLSVSTVRSQDTKGVSGVAEKDDELGSSLTWVRASEESPGPELAAGAPGETVDGHKAAGAVTYLDFGSSCVQVGCRTITQNTKASPHAAEAGDRFGASLSTIGDGNLEELAGYSAVIGVPGEDIGSVTNAGAYAGETGYMRVTRGNGSGEALGEVAASLKTVW